MAAVRPSECRCLRCVDLASELHGYAAADRLAPRLCRRGWVGSRTTAETMWLRAHPPRWWVHNREAAVEALQTRLRASVWGRSTN
jgi:hypothetical protein